MKLWTTFIGLVVLSCAITAQEFEQQAFFSGPEYIINLKIPAKVFSRKGATWVITSKESRIGQGKLSANDQDIKFMMKDLRPNMVIPAVMRISGTKRRIAQTWFFFSRIPFTEMRNLDKIKIGLWPADGALAKTFERFNLSHEKTTKIQAFSGDILFIDGVDFAVNKELLAQIFELAQSGKKIIVTPPFTGTVKIENKMFSKVTFFPQSGLRAMRREFDNLPLDSAINISGASNALSLNFNAESNGIGGALFNVGNGCVMFSGWSLKDENNPTGIYLLRHYLLPSFR